MNSAIPVIFQNCVKEYRSKDIKYVNCNIPLYADPCKLLKELHEAKDIRKYILAAVPLILATFAILLNVAYGIFIVVMWRKKKLGSLHHYSFIMSRTVSSVLALVLFYIILVAWKLEIFRYASAAVFILVGSLTFFTSSGTYVAVTTLLYLAIVHPLRYRYSISVSKCFVAIAIIWLISVAFSLCLGLYGATLFYPETSPIHCAFEQCQRPVAIVVTSFLSIFFVVVVAFYLIMLYFIHNRDYSGRLETDDALAKSNIRTVNKLALNMLTFTAGSLPILIVAAIATANLKNLAALGLGDKSACKTFLNGRLFLQVEILACVAAIVWVLAMIFDPVINFFADPRFMNSICSCWTRFACQSGFLSINHRTRREKQFSEFGPISSPS